MIFYDIKSLTWYPTISWTVCETCIFLQTLEAKITVEIQRNVKLLHLLNEKVICLTVREKKKYNFAPKLEAATLAGARVNFTDSAETFLVSKMEPDFSNFFLNLDFQDSENETPNKRIKQNGRWGVGEEYWRPEKCKYVSLYNAWLITVTKKKSRVLGRIWVR